MLMRLLPHHPLSSILDDCSRIGGRWHTRATLPGRRLDRLLDSARILWNPTVADDSHWLVARSLARGIPAVVADAPHMRDGFQGDITSIPKPMDLPRARHCGSRGGPVGCIDCPDC